jgi:hypothetical protein
MKKVSRNLIFIFCFSFALSASAKIQFLQNATEQTMPEVLTPWTQDDACACCVCWAAALTTIMDYWNRYSFQGKGPWRKLIPNGVSTDAAAFRDASQKLFDGSAIACKGGSLGVGFFNTYQSYFAAKAYSNTALGYSFSYDDDSWVWFGTDIKDEIDAGKPVYYGYSPEGNTGHAVTLVGYDDTSETLYLYKNWLPVVTKKGFDEASDHGTLNITPAGEDTIPPAWTCSKENYDARDGCHCGCGAIDPDCDDPTAEVKNCASGQTCAASGQCKDLCFNLCQVNEKKCADPQSVASCKSSPSTNCTEWVESERCDAGEKCDAGNCVCKNEHSSGFRRCTDNGHYQIYQAGAGGGCALWHAPQACVVGTECQQGSCVPSSKPDTDPVPADAGVPPWARPAADSGPSKPAPDAIRPPAQAPPEAPVGGPNGGGGCSYGSNGPVHAIPVVLMFGLAWIFRRDRD